MSNFTSKAPPGFVMRSTSSKKVSHYIQKRPSTKQRKMAFTRHTLSSGTPSAIRLICLIPTKKNIISVRHPFRQRHIHEIKLFFLEWKAIQTKSIMKCSVVFFRMKILIQSNVQIMLDPGDPGCHIRRGNILKIGVQGNYVET